MADDYIVEMRHITKRFPGVLANDDISIGIKKGEIFAFLGENGAGKSTLMSILFGMYECDEGEIFVRGRKAVLSSSNDAAALNIGMVHQHFKLAPGYTIAENIILGMEPVKKILGVFPQVDVQSASRRIRELSHSYGLDVDPSLRIDQVNVSIQQRVEILKMLYRDAEILIFDEPTAVLTPQEIEFLLTIMRELRDKGKTIILITHKLEEIKKIASRCAILRRGRLITVLNVADASTQEMANLMVGREVSFTRKKKAPRFRDTVLEVAGLTVRNEWRFEVVKDVSFSIRGGEIFAIAGVSGNGQIEIADAVAGLIKPSRGSIRLKGKDITAARIRERIEAGLSYIPEDRQKYGLILDFTLQDNLAVKRYYLPPFSFRGVLNEGGFRDFAEDLIRRYDIRSGQGGKTPARSMSGGNQQKAIVAREISLDSDLLMFVQPTRGLDIGAIENIQNQILEERDRGKAILLISLELDEVMSLADTIGVIYNGKIRNIAPADSLSANEVGEYMMGVKE
ncbi:MAG: ABC transporter ATP-binding protein [Spirochaetaceae bacterium]|jgi:simple sugar transport system ATP-binding protein|nr:ABC transporter ATP-binding protein [Spirochaetaceae bacterium]